MRSRDRGHHPSQAEVDGVVGAIREAPQLAPASNLLGLAVNGSSPSAIQVSYCARCACPCIGHLMSII